MRLSCCPEAQAWPRGSEAWARSKPVPTMSGFGGYRPGARQRPRPDAETFGGSFMVCPLWVAKAIPIPVAQEEAANSGFGPNRRFPHVCSSAAYGGRADTEAVAWLWHGFDPR